MYCILVSGMPASGKSTIARQLSALMALPLLSKDSIKEILFDELGFSSREEKVRLGVAAMRTMYYAAGQLMRAGTPFILENNFEDASVEGIEALLKEHDCFGVTLRLTGEPSVIYRRFAARDLSGNRHRGHVVNDRYPEPEGAIRENPSRKSEAQFLQDVEARGYARFRAGEALIEVDATDPACVDCVQLVRRIQSVLPERQSSLLPNP